MLIVFRIMHFSDMIFFQKSFQLQNLSYQYRYVRQFEILIFLFSYNLLVGIFCFPVDFWFRFLFWSFWFLFIFSFWKICYILSHSHFHSHYHKFSNEYSKSHFHFSKAYLSTLTNSFYLYRIFHLF